MLIVKTDVQVKLFCSFEELAALQEQWDSLAASAGSGIFLTYDWCRIWWKYYGRNRDLKVWVFQKGTDLVGIVPLFLETIWLGPVSMRVARLVGSDHTLAQFSLPIVSDHLEEVVEGLAESLLGEKWDILHIGPIAGLYRHYDALKDALYGAFGYACSISCNQKQVQTYYFLANTWEAQLASLSKNGRKHIRRSHRELERVMRDQPGDLASDCATIQNVDEIFLGFVRMHQKHWEKRGRPGHFGDWPDSFDFHRELAHAQLERGRLRLMRIHWGECCLAYEYAYRFGDTYFAFLSARTDCDDLADVGMGSIMFAEQIKAAMSENVRYIDDMEAKYEHKLRLGGKLFPMKDIYVVRKQPLCLARVRVFRLLSKLLHLGYCRIWYMRIAPRLPLRRRPLWRIWIRSHAFSQ
ncbi:MAG: GNAT family N-acetyltransferase [Bacteroidota bacterium]|mgnify:CR=1 FL=1